MGQSESVQAEAIAELYLREGASSMRRRVLESGVIRIALFVSDRNQPVSVWHVAVDGTITRQVEA
jgi:hypothetical protein